MGDTSDGELYDRMEYSNSKNARKKSWSAGSSDDERKRKEKRSKPPGSGSEDDNNTEKEWKVIITLSDDKGHFHPIKVAKEIESKIGKVKYAKLLNNRRLLISVGSKSQQEKLLKLTQLEGGSVKTHIPGSAAKLRG